MSISLCPTNDSARTNFPLAKWGGGVHSRALWGTSCKILYIPGSPSRPGFRAFGLVVFARSGSLYIGRLVQTSVFHGSNCLLRMRCQLYRFLLLFFLTSSLMGGILGINELGIGENERGSKACCVRLYLMKFRRGSLTPISAPLRRWVAVLRQCI